MARRSYSPGRPNDSRSQWLDIVVCLLAGSSAPQTNNWLASYSNSVPKSTTCCMPNKSRLTDAARSFNSHSHFHSCSHWSHSPPTTSDITLHSAGTCSLCCLFSFISNANSYGLALAACVLELARRREREVCLQKYIAQPSLKLCPGRLFSPLKPFSRQVTFGRPLNGGCKTLCPQSCSCPGEATS